MKRKNEKVKKIRQILVDKLYYNEYYGGLFIEFDDCPFYNLPMLVLHYNYDDISHVIPEKYLDKLSITADKVDHMYFTKIKFKDTEINTVEEFLNTQTEFLDLMIELSEDLPENPAWNKFTFPHEKSTKISSSTIN